MTPSYVFFLLLALILFGLGIAGIVKLSMWIEKINNGTSDEDERSKGLYGFGILCSLIAISLSFITFGWNAGMLK